MSAAPVPFVVRACLLEAVRRREFYVLFLFMGLFVAGIVVASIVKVENAATATFLLNLGMTLAFGLAKLATLLAAARQVPDDTENGTIYPLLAKPLGRGEYLVGKAFGALLPGLSGAGRAFRAGVGGGHAARAAGANPKRQFGNARAGTRPSGHVAGGHRRRLPCCSRCFCQRW